MVAKFWISTKLWSFKYGRKTKTTEKMTFDFPVHDCTKEQNGSPYLCASFDNANDRPSRSRKYC